MPPATSAAELAALDFGAEEPPAHCSHIRIPAQDSQAGAQFLERVEHLDGAVRFACPMDLAVHCGCRTVRRKLLNGSHCGQFVDHKHAPTRGHGAVDKLPEAVEALRGHVR